MPDPTPGLPSDTAPQGLAQYIVDRLGFADDKADTAREFFINLTPVILEQISSATDVPIPSTTYYNEAVYVSGRYDIAYPENWPVSQVTAAQVGGTVLKVGTLLELAQGQADIAVAQGWKGFQLSPSVAGMAPTTLFVTYRAGYDSLPPDLLEVFVEWSLLVMKEKDRVGQKSTKIDLGLMQYTRDIPAWAQSTLWRYRRTESYCS